MHLDLAQSVVDGSAEQQEREASKHAFCCADHASSVLCSVLMSSVFKLFLNIISRAFAYCLEGPCGGPSTVLTREVFMAPVPLPKL